ncbi:MAG: hypothetical protein AABW51_05455 [Nanoarchaeota archaeon]
MEIFKDEIKRKLKEGQKSFELKMPLSGDNFASLSVTSLNGSVLNLDMPDNQFKIRFQTLISGTQGFEKGSFRMDNHAGKPIHTHFFCEEDNQVYENILSPMALGSSFKMILGSAYFDLENSIRS